MNYFVDRCSHLFPSLPEAWYTIPLRRRLRSQPRLSLFPLEFNRPSALSADTVRQSPPAAPFDENYI
jgi:hypothetical protein